MSTPAERRAEALRKRQERIDAQRAEAKRRKASDQRATRTAEYNRFFAKTDEERGGSR